LDAQAFFFDLDDTLVDFGKARREALEALAGELAARIPQQSPDQIQQTRARIVEERNRLGRGMPQTGDLGNARIRVWIEVLAFIGAPDLAEPEQLVDDHDKLTRRHLELYPDAEAAIRWAAERFEITGIITNGPSDVQWGEVRAVGLEDRMDRVIVAGDVGAYKPDPRIFQAALEGLGLPPHACAFIGNSADHDVAGALTVGWSALWLNRNGASYPPSLPQPTATVTSLNDLPALFA
jgi:2-haloalkanoic acid dehalogenase type II